MRLLLVTGHFALNFLFFFFCPGLFSLPFFCNLSQHFPTHAPSKTTKEKTFFFFFWWSVDRKQKKFACATCVPGLCGHLTSSGDEEESHPPLCLNGPPPPGRSTSKQGEKTRLPPRSLPRRTPRRNFLHFSRRKNPFFFPTETSRQNFPSQDAGDGPVFHPRPGILARSAPDPEKPC